MRRLNHTYREINKSTDVLSFPLQSFQGKPPYRPLKGERSFMLGDIVIEAELAHRQALEAGHATYHEYRVLLVHGILHLLGFDHEADESSGRRMRGKERKLLLDLNSG